MRLLIIIFAFMIGGCNLTNAEDIDIDGGLIDYSNVNATKEIKSKAIKSFKLKFFDEVDDELNGIYELYIKEVDEKILMIINNSEVNEIKEIDEKVLSELQELIDNEKIVKINGHNKWNSALGNYLDLKIIYESGESITAHCEGGENVMPDCNPKVFLKFFYDKMRGNK